MAGGIADTPEHLSRKQKAKAQATHVHSMTLSLPAQACTSMVSCWCGRRSWHCLWIPPQFGIATKNIALAMHSYASELSCTNTIRPTLGATDALEHLLSPLKLSTLDQTVGCVGQEQSTNKQHDTGDASEAQAQTPAPWVDLLGTIVDQLGHKDTCKHKTHNSTSQLSGLAFSQHVNRPGREARLM